MDRRSFLAGAAGLALAPAAYARTFGGTPIALVTADLEEHVVAFDLSARKVVRRIATVAGPRAIDSPDGVVAVVAHTSEGAVSLLDGVDLRVRRVLRGFGEPRYAATTKSHAYVTDSRRGEVAVIDLQRARVVHRVDVDGPARHISVSPNGRRLWASLGNAAKHIAVLDLREPAAPRLAATVTPPYLAHDVGFTPSDLRVWVTSGDRRSFGVYDAVRRELVYRRVTGAAPQHVTFVGGRAYVTSGDDGTLDVHALPGGAVLHRAAIPGGSFNVQQGWGLVLTPSLSQGTLCVVHPNGRLRDRVRVARSSHDACFVMSR